ncbi:hypothetical protein ACLQ26_20080 [Micromonospora sp. DT43]
MGGKNHDGHRNRSAELREVGAELTVEVETLDSPASEGREEQR